MAQTFVLKGNAYNAVRALGRATATLYNSANISILTDATALSGAYLDLSNALVVKYLAYDGFSNTPNGRTFSVILRIKPAYTGYPSISRSIFVLSSGASYTSAYLELRHDSNGNLALNIVNAAGGNCIGVNMGLWSPTTKAYDFVLQWDGTTTVNSVKFYIDNALFYQGSPGAALESNWDNTFWKSILIGAGINVYTSQYYYDEVVIEDTLINPASYNLQSGLGALSGSTRTSPIAYTPYFGQLTADDVWNHAKALTIGKFLGLK